MVKLHVNTVKLRLTFTKYSLAHYRRRTSQYAMPPDSKQLSQFEYRNRRVILAA